jgi:hypothetical protein
MGQSRSPGMILAAIATFSLIGSPTMALAAKASAAGDYQLAINHRLLAQFETGSKVGLELELTLTNGGPHGLYDLRLFLTQAGPIHVNRECAPARMRVLNQGGQDGLTWVFECVTLVLPSEALQQLEFRIEAIDQATQDIVSFVSVSREAR